MKVRTSFMPVLLTLALCLAVPSIAAAQAPPTRAALSIPIAGTANNGSTFAGTFNITRFVQQHGTVYAVGTIVGNATGAADTAVTAVAVPVTVDPTCPILHLHTGAINLDVLGLVVNIA